MRRSGFQLFALQIGGLLALLWGPLTAGATPYKPAPVQKTGRLPFKYLLPWVHRGDADLGKHDPMWGRAFPDLPERMSDEPPAIHIGRLREFAKQNPEQRQRVATYMRVLRRLEHHVRDRAVEHARQSAPSDELSFEYQLPHLPQSTLPRHLPDPLHGYVQGGVVHYTHGQQMTKKAPHVYIAMLRRWAEAHPEGRATAQAYIALFEKNAPRLREVDLQRRQQGREEDHVREGLAIERAVVERDEARRAGRITLAPVAPPPFRDHLSRGTVSNPDMPAFKKLVAGSQAAKDRPLAGFRILGLQHLLSNTGAFIRALADAGVRPEDTAMMGKTYSQHRPVVEELRKEGFSVHEAQFESSQDVIFGHGGMPSSGAKHNRKVELDEMVRQIVSGKGQAFDPHAIRSPIDRSHKYLVVDDGGELIEHIHKHYPELHDRVVAVEQTRKGIRRVQEIGSLRFPVINMAEAKAKLELESPMIGRALAVSAMKRLDRIKEAGVDPGKEILLVGYGAVGARAAAALRQAGYKVSVFDTSAEAQARAAQDGHAVHGAPPPGLTPLQHALSQSKIVLSTTGTNAITQADLEHARNGTVFMNGASSSTEITPSTEDLMKYQNWPKHQGDGLYTTVAGKRFQLGKVKVGGDPQMDWVLRTPSGKEHILVGRGQVINFDNGPGVLPPRYAQLIVGLLYMSSLQAAQTTKPGIHALDESKQAAYVKDVQADLAKTGESLEAPRF